MSGLFVDYAVFGLLILGTIAFNIWAAFSGSRERTKADYAFSTGPPISTISILLSLARGFLGVKVFLGYPSEFFYRGCEMWETLYGMLLVFPVVAYFFIPIYFSLGVTSVYQYLDLRFKSRLVRCLASGTYVVRSLMNLGVTVFTPCVALKTIIGMPYPVSIITISSVGIFFTMVGGLRSAVMADVAQTIAMMGCTFIIIIQGTLTAGGPVNVVEKARERGRLELFNFDMDPTKRVTAFSALIGQFFISLSMYGCQQNFVQRYLSMKSPQRAIRTLWINIPFMAVLFTSSWIVGMVIFYHYADCDPMIAGLIQSIDEITLFYIEDKFVFLPGFLGLTMACLFNGSLNVFVSNLNSIAIVTWEDFLSPIPYMKNLPDKGQLYTIKISAAVMGVCIMFISFIVSNFSGVIESSQLLASATSGPLLGVFALAMFFPVANWKGAASGMIISHLVTTWIIFGAKFSNVPSTPYLPTTDVGCTNDTFSKHITLKAYAPANETLFMPSPFADSDPNLDSLDDIFDNDNDTYDDLSSKTPEITPAESEEDVIYYLYRISYMYYAFLGTFITVFVGVCVSYMTESENDSYSINLIHPYAHQFSVWLPGRARSYESEFRKRKPDSANSKAPSCNSVVVRLDRNNANGMNGDKNSDKVRRKKCENRKLEKYNQAFSPDDVVSHI